MSLYFQNAIHMRKLLAALSTAVLLSIAWPANGSLTPLVFGAFIPMLWLEKTIRLSDSAHRGRQVFFYGWLSFGLFNLGTTWWVSYAHWSGTLATTIVNGGLMAFCFWLFHIVSRNLGEGRGLILLPFLWMPLEYLHMDWDMSFPWLNLGYVFANRPTWIQWYSLTGIWGGTLWVLWVNAILFRSFLPSQPKATLISWVMKSIFIIGLPVGLSFWMYSSYEEVGRTINVVSVQPNLDPYTVKFRLDDEETVDRFIAFAKPYLSDSTDYLVGPETMIGKGRLNEATLSYTRAIQKLQQLSDSLPKLRTVIGLSSYLVYHTKETKTARFLGDRGYLDQFNTSVQIGPTGVEIPRYHKSKLVVGVEKVPFKWIFEPLLSGGLDLGGAMGTLGGQPDRAVFVRDFDSTTVATPVCWEADFPGYTAEFVRNGAQVLFAITNDGWWSNTPGKTQHMYYASVRAIENRRDVVRSSNTGISCYINQRGDISNQIPYESDGAFAATVHLNEEMTLFTKSGDVGGRVSIFISIAVLLSILVKLRTGR